MTEKNYFVEKSSQIKFILERLRILPRAFIIGYMILLSIFVTWATGMPELTNAQATIISTVTGIAAIITKFYVDTGKNLYGDHTNIKYTSGFVKYVDRIGYVINKFRLFPLIFVIFFCYEMVDVLLWSFELGSELTMQQASFTSTFVGTASIVLGFFISAGEVNMKLEQTFMERLNYNDNLEESNDDKQSIENQKTGY